MYGLGILYKNGLGVPVDYKKAREYYEKAAQMGNSDGINYLFLLQLFRTYIC